MAQNSVSNVETIKALTEQKILLPELNLITSNYLQPIFHITGPIHFNDYTEIYSMKPGSYTLTSYTPGYLRGDHAYYIIHPLNIDPLTVLHDYQHPRKKNPSPIRINTLTILDGKDKIIDTLSIRDIIDDIHYDSKISSIILSSNEAYVQVLQAVDYAGGRYLNDLTLRDLNQLFYPYRVTIEPIGEDIQGPEIEQPIRPDDLRLWFGQVPSIDLRYQDKPMYMEYDGTKIILSEDEAYGLIRFNAEEEFEHLAPKIKHFIYVSNGYALYAADSLHRYILNYPDIAETIEEVYRLIRYELFLTEEQLKGLNVEILSDSQVVVNGVVYTIGPSSEAQQTHNTEQNSRLQAVLPISDVSNLTLQYLNPL